jgi:hypothetical protein
MERVLLGVVVVSTKPISGKYSWTVHATSEKAVREVNSSLAAREMGRHFRRLHRINIYEAPLVSLLADLCGTGRSERRIG